MVSKNTNIITLQILICSKDKTITSNFFFHQISFSSNVSLFASLNFFTKKNDFLIRPHCCFFLLIFFIFCHLGVLKLLSSSSRSLHHVICLILTFHLLFLRHRLRTLNRSMAIFTLCLQQGR